MAAEDAGRVYAAVLDQIPSSYEVLVWDRIQPVPTYRGCASLNGPWRDAYASLQRTAGALGHLDRRFATERAQVRWLDDAQVEQVERDVAQKRYGILGIKAFTLVAFDLRGTTAAVGVATCSGLRCGPPSVVFLNKIDSVWKVDSSHRDTGCLPIP